MIALIVLVQPTLGILHIGNTGIKMKFQNEYLVSEIRKHYDSGDQTAFEQWLKQREIANDSQDT